MDINRDNIALGIQTRLLQNLINLVRASDGEGMLKPTLQKAIDLTAEIAGAEAGSLFLLDPAGIVTDCIMIRETLSQEDRDQLIGCVLNEGLAGWVVEHHEVGLIHDTHHDDRWLELPDQPYTARSAVVIPILKGKILFGILSLVHSNPDRFNDETVDLMKATADHIAVVLENAKLYDSLRESFHQLEKAKETIEAYSNALTEELEKGRHMQRTFLPKKMPDIPGWEIDACFYPAKQVSGDLYDIFANGDQQLGIIIADVCDKGVSAALFMGIFRSLIHAYIEGVHTGNNPIQPLMEQPVDAITLSHKALGALAFLNQYIHRHHGGEGIFATLFFGILNIPEGRLDYINAGHEPLMIIGRDETVRELPPTGPAIGISARSHFDLQSVWLDYGETLIGFTDGITDACISGGKRFCRTGVQNSIRRAGKSGKGFLQSIIGDVFAHLGCCNLTDDIAMISIGRV